MAGQPCTFRLHYTAGDRDRPGDLRDRLRPRIGRQRGRAQLRPNGCLLGRRRATDTSTFVVPELLLQPATYQVSTAIVDRGHIYDYADREFDVRVRATGEQEPGLTRMPGDLDRTRIRAAVGHRTAGSIGRDATC